MELVGNQNWQLHGLVELSLKPRHLPCTSQTKCETKDNCRDYTHVLGHSICLPGPPMQFTCVASDTTVLISKEICDPPEGANTYFPWGRPWQDQWWCAFRRFSKLYRFRCLNGEIGELFQRLCEALLPRLYQSLLENVIMPLRKCMNIQTLMCAPLTRFSISLSDLLVGYNRLMACGFS